MNSWINKVIEGIPGFLERLKVTEIKGFYRYSLSGDKLPPSKNWGLAQAVFAAKIHYMLNTLAPGLKSDLSDFILTFQDSRGYISDPQIAKLSLILRIKSALKSRDFNNIFNQQTRRAETRQSFAALKCLGSSPVYPCTCIPDSQNKITAYINKLNWREPWGASSHFSHLIFFLKNNLYSGKQQEEKAEAHIKFAFSQLDRLQHDDGSWYQHGIDIPINQKINSAMKIMMAYMSVKGYQFDKPEKLIDLALSTINGGHACNNLNIVLVLFCCSKLTTHRSDEIKEYLRERLHLFQHHYWPEYGGFSFYPRNANDIYYGARLTESKKEPDIHGTALFLWGIVLIGEVLGYSKGLKLTLPVT